MTAGAEDVAIALRRWMPATELMVLDAAGHASIKTSPIQCATIALDFLRRVAYVMNAACNIFAYIQYMHNDQGIIIEVSVHVLCGHNQFNAFNQFNSFHLCN